MSGISNSVTITWVDPTVNSPPTTGQLALAFLTVWENDIVAGTQTNIGTVAPGTQEFTTGYALPPGADRTYQVQATDIGGNAGPLSAATAAVTVPPTPAATLPGAPTGVAAALNP